MPFIRGRYHINPVMGEALEAARDAEAALLALKQNARHNGDAGNAAGDADAGDSAAKGPVHRVEIEAAEMVPSHSGRAQRGYALRLHRLPPPNSDTGYGADGDSDSNADSYGVASRYTSHNAAPAGPAQSDTHIFANPDDLLDFLRAELADDCAAR